LAVDALGLPVRVVITAGTVADCTQASDLMQGFEAKHLLADKGYDSDTIINQAKAQNMKPIIPPKRNRKIQREYDTYLYRMRHLVENAFLHLKRWRGIATRYAKNTASFLAIVQIRCALLWATIS
jgi:transposase